jgi:hypothetical protein
MQAERSDAASGYDTFTCLRCDLVLSYRHPAGSGSDTNKPDRPR